jgi:hypothetical protein
MFPAKRIVCPELKDKTEGDTSLLRPEFIHSESSQENDYFYRTFRFILRILNEISPKSISDIFTKSETRFWDPIFRETHKLK